MAKDAREQGIADREAAKQQGVADYYARSEASKPTPTQAESDAAKVGLPVELEPDGSEPEEVTVQRVMQSRMPGHQPYETRAVSADEPRRGPGRPPKADKPE